MPSLSIKTRLFKTNVFSISVFSTDFVFVFTNLFDYYTCIELSILAQFKKNPLEVSIY